MPAHIDQCIPASIASEIAEPPNRPGMQRISVVGTTGSGKTTFAERLAGRLGYAHVELDSIHWGPGWTPLETDEFRRRLAPHLAAESWVVDGNYGKVRDLVWARADTVVWLDYSLATIMGRLALRTYRRVARREELWNGNREHFRVQLFSRDSLFLWALRTYDRRRREIPEWLSMPAYAHLSLVRCQKPEEAKDWLRTLPGEPADDTVIDMKDL